VGRAVLIGGILARLGGQGSDSRLRPPQKLQRADDAIRRAPTGPHKPVKGAPVGTVRAPLCGGFPEKLPGVVQTLKCACLQKRPF
jgi:hypothetical protein